MFVTLAYDHCVVNYIVLHIPEKYPFQNLDDFVFVFVFIFVFEFYFCI